MKSKKQKNNLRKSKIRYNQRYLQTGGTLIYIIYMGRVIEIDTDTQITIADLKDNILRLSLLPISLEQRFLMVLSERSIGECYDWVPLNDIIRHLGQDERLQLTLTLNPLAVNTIAEMFNIDRFAFTSVYRVNRERNLILRAIIYTLFQYYSRYISDLRKAIDGIVTPLEVFRPISRRGEFKIYIRTLTNSNYELMVLSTDTVHDIKLMIEKITEIRPHKARLLLTECTLDDGRPVTCQLEDGRTLASYNITANRTLKLVLHLGPSKCGCEKYKCESCIMSQMKIRCMIDQIEHPETEVNQSIIVYVSRQIRENQNEIIHLTRVLHALRGQIPPPPGSIPPPGAALGAPPGPTPLGPPPGPPPALRPTPLGLPPGPPPALRPTPLGLPPGSIPPPGAALGAPPGPPPALRPTPLGLPPGPPPALRPTPPGPPPGGQSGSRPTPFGPPPGPPLGSKQPTLGPPPGSRQQPPPGQGIGEDRPIFQMGFNRQLVIQALQQTNNNEEEALNLIIASLN
jgi:hypothetical protein